MNWWKSLKDKIKFDEELKKHTTFKVGGPAQYFLQAANPKELQSALSIAKSKKIPVLVIGAGSNLLASDKGVKGLVIKLDSAEFKKITANKNIIFSGAASLISRVIHKAKNSGLCGLEFLAGIPGTIGGGLIMNAGAWGKSIADLVEELKVMDYNGRIKQLKRNEIKFGYRDSDLSEYIILSAKLKLNKESKKAAAERIAEYLSRRRNAQDFSGYSAGCIFKNPEGESAGKLIELCGLKGVWRGGAMVSKKHANFILNRGKAKAKDVLSLISLIKNEVKNKFKIDLETEVKIWG